MCYAFDSRSRVANATYGHNTCELCHTRFLGVLSALVFDYVDLSQIIARRQGHSDAKIARPKPESVPPIDLTVDTLRSDIAWGLRSCEFVLRDARRQRVVNLGPSREGHRVQRAARLVTAHLDEFAGLPLPAWFPLDGDDDGAAVLGADALLSLRRLHERARRLLGITDLVISLPGYCEVCRSATLRRRNGSDTVHCGACLDAQTWPEYQARVKLAVTRTGGDHIER
jgi:hypothetical protein